MTTRSILFVIGSLGLGGAEKHVANLAVALKNRGWRPSLFVLSTGGPLTGLLETQGIPIEAAHIPRVVRNIANDRLRARISLIITAMTLWAYLWRQRPDVVHFFLPAAYIIGGLVSVMTPVRAKIMSRRSLNHYQSKHRLFGKIERWLHPHMKLVLANSAAVKADLVAEGVNARKIRLIYNGIDVSPFDATPDRSKLRQSENIAEDALVMVMVANLIPYKGHKDLLDALGRINGQLPDGWLLLCVGRDDGIGVELADIAARMGIARNVRFCGSRPDVANLFKLSDIGLLTSHEEGFSNSVLEGMAAGLPMVVTDVGGNAEAVQDGNTGFVVPSRTPEALGDAIVQLLDPVTRQKLGGAGRTRVESQFSLHASIDHYETVYREV